MRTHVCYYKINRTYVFKCKEVAELGDRSAMETGLCMDIPIRVMALTDRDGRITPYWIRLESPDHQIHTYRIHDIVSRGEKNYVGIREKQFVCHIQVDDLMQAVELRCNMESQQWRVAQLL